MSTKINFRTLIFLCCFCITATMSYGQDDKSVFSILEKDRDGGYQKKDSSYINSRVVDINSILQIDLDLGIITSKLEKNTTGLPAGHGEKIEKLTKALKERKEVLKAFDSLLNSYDYDSFKENPKRNEEWASAIQQPAMSVVSLWDVSPYIEFGDPNQGVVSLRPAATYQRAQTELERMTKEVEDFAEKQGVYVQFGAWLYKKDNQNTPLHIPGFDSIEPQPSYQVDRWRILPTSKQLANLQEATSLAKDNKDKGLSVIKSTVDIQVKQLEEVLTGEFNSLVDSLSMQARQIVGASITSIITDIDTFKINIEKIKSTVKQRISYYKGLDVNEQLPIPQVLTNIESDISFITNESQILVNQANKLYDDIKTLVDNTTSEGKVLGRLSGDIKKYLEDWKGTLLKSTSVAQIRGFLLGTPVDFGLLKFSDKVFKLSLKDLPNQADLDLYTTGIRQGGDRIAFKFEIATKEKTIYTENREVYMFRVLPHIESSVGVIFADPLARTNVQTQFQMAPYYNLIFKGLFDQKIRRKSVAYNRILNWGIGLHISAPDFDGDDVPELGTGIVLSGLNDYIQSGIAINVFTGDPYWFFGLKLPIPSFNIGSNPTSSN